MFVKLHAKVDFDCTTHSEEIIFFDKAFLVIILVMFSIILDVAYNSCINCINEKSYSKKVLNCNQWNISNSLFYLSNLSSLKCYYIKYWSRKGVCTVLTPNCLNCCIGLINGLRVINII